MSSPPGNFQSLCRLAQLFLNTSAIILQKKRAKSLEEIFSSFENAIWSILLKYQEIFMQNKHSLTKIETSYIVAFLNGTNCRLVHVDYKY